jgi:P2 family phage major capsid protein
MRNDTRIKFTAYLQKLASLSSIPSAEHKFTVSPTTQQRLESRMQETSAFLQSINMIGVAEQSGSKVGIGVSGTIAGRTNTTTTDRTPRDVGALDEFGYNCKKTDFDTAVTYAQLDAWAKFTDFRARLANAILRQQALDRIMIGFNGTSAATATDRTAHPLLQDVNIGWLQKIRTDAATRVMAEGAATGKVTYGAGGDYANLDALVFDAVMMLDPWYRENPDLRVIVSRDLMHDKYFPLVNTTTDPTEMLAADVIISQKRVGGLQAIGVPYFPAGKILITATKNLSLYWQESARRRMVQDNPKRDRIENYESSNDAYVVEDYGMVALIENIEKKV